MDDSERNRTLRMEIPPSIYEKVPEEEEWDVSEPYANGWTIIPLDGIPTLAVGWAGTIDLSGYARDYKTFYPSGGVLQQGSYQACRGGEGTINLTVVSSVPLSLENILGQIIYGTGPGFLNHGLYAELGIGEKQQDWNTVMFSQSELFVPNVNISPNVSGVLNPMNTQQSGSMSPTATQVLYVAKVVYPFGEGQSLLTIPASRVILPGVMDQEPELEYMMRLSRSVELANQV